MKIVLATANQGKLKEIQSSLTSLDITLIPQSDFDVPSIEETGLSFVENAILKARHAAQYSQLPALADDSGLAVDALDGAPGIFSARFAGINANDQDNIKKLLASMHSKENRTARFHCAIVYVRHYQDPVPLIACAQWDGEILQEPIGNNGFGYDPVFYIPALGCSVAQLSSQQKNSLSHRAKALAEFVKQFKLL